MTQQGHIGVFSPDVLRWDISICSTFLPGFVSSENDTPRALRMGLWVCVSFRSTETIELVLGGPTSSIGSKRVDAALRRVMGFIVGFIPEGAASLS